MNELQSKIFTLKLLQLIFKILFVISCVLFVFFGFEAGSKGLQNELIFSFLTAFNFVTLRVIEYYLKEYKMQIKSFRKNKRHAKIIPFEKIA